eukprot:364785-Chlamydomonas_euryale.AAC.1
MLQLPGRLTLLLGPPSSGKTSFMKYLCGRLTAVGLKGSGDVRYNGHTFDEFNVIRTSANCGQIDVHIPNCTVLETLDFAHRCTQGSTADLAVMYQLLLRAAAGSDEWLLALVRGCGGWQGAAGAVEGLRGLAGAARACEGLLGEGRGRHGRGGNRKEGEEGRGRRRCWEREGRYWWRESLGEGGQRGGQSL